MIELPGGYCARINEQNIHIQKDYLKVCVEIYPPPGSASYAYFYCDHFDRALTQEEVEEKTKRDLVPKHKELTPCLNHFLTINPATTKKELEGIIKTIFDANTLQQLDMIQGDREQPDLLRHGKLRGLMNIPTRLGSGKVLRMGKTTKDRLLEQLKDTFKEGEL